MVHPAPTLLIGSALLLALAPAACKNKDAASAPPEPASAPAPRTESPDTPPAEEEAEPESEPEGPAAPSAEELVSAQIELGERLYEEQCAKCHGAEGEGKKGKFPAVWGDGALPERPRKTARTRKQPFESAQDVADFVRTSMPPKQGDSLSEEEAYALVSVMLRGNGVELDEPLDEETAPETAPVLPDDDE